MSYSIHTHNYSTGVRLRAAAQIARRFLNGRATNSAPMILDVGSGRYGIAAFLSDIPVHSVDPMPLKTCMPGVTFVQADVKALPYRDRIFPVVCCIDVLEHLPVTVRLPAIAELVRVAECLLVIACPYGSLARDCDSIFLEALRAKGRTPPDWLTEHQRQPYPDAALLAGHVQECAAFDRPQGRDFVFVLRASLYHAVTSRNSYPQP